MSILCSMVGATFGVAAAAEVIRRKTSIISLSSTAVSTSVSKFGGASASFNGTTNRIELPHQSQLDLSGYSDWTIECWYYFTEPTARTVLNKDGIAGTAYPGYTFYTNASKQIIFGVGGSAGNWITITRSTALASTTWYHLAAVKSGSTVTFYVDGVSAGTATFVGYTDQGRSLWLGWENNGTYGYGNMDELRISKNARYTTGFTPSTSAFANDDDTVLLVHFDGTNGSTYFEDDNGVRASRSLIAQGNAQVDTAQSKFGGSALLCDGTGDYVVSPAGTQWNFGTSSFTIEYFIRFNVAPTLYVPIALRTSGAINNGEWWCEITNAEKKMYWGFKNQAGTQFYVNLALAGTAFTTGVWYHIALVNNAGTAQLYIDGVATGTTTALSGSFGISTTDLWVGAGAGTYSLNGWMDEVRISNTARYTANFTPATEPFVNDSNTLLLMHMDGTDASTVFRDDNGASTYVYRTDTYATNLKLAVTFDGITGVQDVTPNINTAITTSAAYTMGTNVAANTTEKYFSNYTSSALFTPGGSALVYTLPSNMPSAVSGTWVIEGWFYPTTTTGTRWTISSADSGGRFIFHIAQGVSNNLSISEGNLNYITLTSGWHHIAIVCDAGTKRLYRNGLYLGAWGGGSTGFTGLHIGQFTNADANDYQGYIQDLRVYYDTTKGYTGTNTGSTNFTVPSSIFNYARRQKGIVASGNMQIDTSQSKFGGSSMQGDGTGDYLTTYGDIILTGDFTVEFWMRSGNSTFSPIGNTSTNVTPGAARWLTYYVPGSTRFETYWENQSAQISNTTVNINTWYHIAFVRSGSTIKQYIDGVAQTATITLSGTIGSSTYGSYYIGGLTNSNSLNGHMDEVRISNTARYTANFTPATAPFQNDANTVLLLHMDGTDASTVFIDDNGRTPT